MIRIAETYGEDRAELLRAVGNFRFRLRQCRAARSDFLWSVLHGFACGVASMADYQSRLDRMASAIAGHAERQAIAINRGRISIRIAGEEMECDGA